MHAAATNWIETVLAGSPVARTIGLRFTDIAVDRVVAELPFRADNVTVGDIVHGGIIATLIDIVGAAASGSGIGDDAAGGATASMTVAYLSPASGSDLIAEGIVIQRGRTQTVTDIAVRDRDGRMIAKGLVTSRIFLRRG